MARCVELIVRKELGELGLDNKRFEWTVWRRLSDRHVRARVEIINVDRLAHRIVSQARGHLAVIDAPRLGHLWATAAAEAAFPFTDVFLERGWEQVILAQDLRTEQTYLTCPRPGRGTPLSKAQRAQVWQVAERVTGQLKAAGRSTHIQLANEATHLLLPAMRNCAILWK